MKPTVQVTAGKLERRSCIIFSENREETASHCVSDGVPESGKRLLPRGLMGSGSSRLPGCRYLKSNKTGNYRLTYKMKINIS